MNRFGALGAPLALAISVGLAALLTFATPTRAATASWSLTPASYDFGYVETSLVEPPSTILTLTNTGDVELPTPRVLLKLPQLESDPSPALFFHSRDCEMRPGLASGESCQIQVYFRPSQPGLREGTITVSDPSSTVPPVAATVRGTGRGLVVSLSPPVFDLGSYLLGIGPSLAKVLTMTNTGAEPLSINAIAFQGLGSNPDGVALVGGSCAPGITVAPGASCTLQAVFTPTRAGSFEAKLRIEDVTHNFEEVVVRWSGAGESGLPRSRAARILQRPRAKTTRRAATFRFAIEGGGIAFLCRLDRAPYRPCSSPRTYRHLALGQHDFRVKPASTPAWVSGAVAEARFRVLPKHQAQPGT